MSTIDDLLSRRRRGALSDADERRLQMAVQTSREHQLTLLAGEVFERAGAAQPGDTALIKRIVHQVEGEWSGTFQRVVARGRVSRWVSVPMLMAGLAAASFGGYRAVHALRPPADNSPPRALAVAAPSRAPAVAAPSEPAPTVPAPSVLAPSVPAPSEPAGIASGAASVPAALPDLAALPLAGAVSAPALDRASVQTPAEEASAAQSTAQPRTARDDAPATARVAALSANAAIASTAPSAAPHWNLPRPKPRALHASVASESELAALLPAPGAPASAGTLAEGAPDLESAQALFRRANQLRRSDWDAAAALYERLTLRHSESAEAGVAEMALAKHALAEGRAHQALRWFQAYQRREDGELAAEALWGEARACQSLGEGERAHELWQRLIEQYPASAYAAAAREQLGP
jgi:hypothetical protein